MMTGFATCTKPGAGVLFVAILQIGACTIQEDPAKGGFLSGTFGILGGGYEARLRENEQVLAREQVQQAALAARRTEIEKQHTAIKQELRQVRQTFDRMSVRVKRLRSQVDAQGAGRAQDSIQLAEAERQLKQVQERLTVLDGEQSNAQGQEEVRDLRLVLENIDSLVRTITDAPAAKSM
jgi:chromosome segregation ATPase